MRRLFGVSLFVVTAVVTAALGHHVPKSSSLSAALPSSAAPPSTSSPAEPPLKPSSNAAPHASRGEPRGVPGEADGVVPDGVTVFDAAIPAVANLDPDLLKALRPAATAAADDGADPRTQQ